ncbi:DUF6779 domain-containing protein [Mycolicibacterium sp. J2]|uniref:DUF6779 domain-containing protein n=1 Tax=Mycolicibacterium sp. J2 TaxID=2993511 RepID=UPI00224B6A28|nr:DUF6779 domain-containing protein [Mycolicibacterium sp. J2]MCX2715104.1 hypothetical protein [Mycolicibacterium sp. J2]
MTDPSRGMRVRRVSRRPGWMLLSVLLVLAIVASSVLVFTNRVELLKLAVVLALWAAVVAAFVSVIYRRQSDVDQAKVRDLKLVYDLQLDREISARREYELAVEAQLRRELTAELRAQAADEVAALRAELAALRNNLEILFDTDLDQRPALETDRPAGRVIASRVDEGERADPFTPSFTPPRPAAEPRTEESPIIDVPAEPPVPEPQWAPWQPTGGAHRRSGEAEQPPPWSEPAPQPSPQVPVQPQPPVAPPARESVWQAPAAPQPEPAPAQAWAPPPPAPPSRPDTGWQPVPAEGQFIPAGAPGSNWVSPPATGTVPQTHPEPAMTPPPVETRRGRHSSTGEPDAPPRSRHATPPENTAAPTLATPPLPQEPLRASEAPGDTADRPARHRGPGEAQPTADTPEESAGQHAGGQPVSELLSRLQAGQTGGGRRRRREE